LQFDQYRFLATAVGSGDAGLVGETGIEVWIAVGGYQLFHAGR
jgi:hypothetical protein